MAYEDVRTAIIQALATVVKRVYAEPSASIQDKPAAIMYGSDGSMQWSAGGTVTPDEEHTERIRIIVDDETVSGSFGKTQAMRIRILDALRTEGGADDYGTITRVSWSNPAYFSYNDKPYIGFDLRISFIVYAP